MKSLLCIGLALGLIAIASSLTCKRCDVRTMGFCAENSGTLSCNGSCFLLNAKLGKIPIFSRQGCDSACKNATDATDSFFNIKYDNTCCDTDLCNSGNSIKISLSLGLGIGLLWLLNAM